MLSNNINLCLSTKKVTQSSAKVCLAAFGSKPTEVTSLTIKVNDKKKHFPLKEWKSVFEENNEQEGPYYQKIKVTGLAPNTQYDLSLLSNKEEIIQSGKFETLPNELPHKTTHSTFRPFTIGFGSCYCIELDKDRLFSTSLENLAKNINYKPYFFGFLGDSVYLDHPASNYYWTPYSEKQLQNDFTAKYQNFYLATRWVRANLSTLTLADDHDYHNRYPDNPLFMKLAQLRDKYYMERWRKVARKLYQAFSSKSAVDQFTIGSDLSFFIADTRSNRQVNKINLLSDEDFKKLTDWVTHLNCPGVLITSQPLFLNKRSYWHPSSFFAEPNITEWKQYDRLIETLNNSSHDIVILSGDVHFSRLARVKNRGGAKIIEAISSPISLIEEDEKKEAGLFGDRIEYFARSKWKLDIDKEPKQFPPSFMAINQDRFDIEYLKAGCPKWHQQTGIIDNNRTEENFATVSFFKSNSQVEMKIKTWLPRLKSNSSNLPKEDWSYQVSLS